MSGRLRCQTLTHANTLSRDVITEASSFRPHGHRLAPKVDRESWSDTVLEIVSPWARLFCHSHGLLLVQILSPCTSTLAATAVYHVAPDDHNASDWHQVDLIMNDDGDVFARPLFFWQGDKCFALSPINPPGNPILANTPS